MTEHTASCSEAQEKKAAYNQLAEQQHEVEEGDTDFQAEKECSGTQTSKEMGHVQRGACCSCGIISQFPGLVFFMLFIV